MNKKHDEFVEQFSTYVLVIIAGAMAMAGAKGLLMLLTVGVCG